MGAYQSRSDLPQHITVPSQSTQDTAQSTPHQPTVMDVIAVKRLLSSSSLLYPLPLEIIDIILDGASYWPHTSVTIDYRCNVGEIEDVMYLRTLPLGVRGSEGDIRQTAAFWDSGLWHWQIGGGTDELVESGEWLPPRGKYPCRKIVFDLSSHDQGWTSEPALEGPYDGSFTWFDVKVETIGYKLDDDTIQPGMPSTIKWSERFFEEGEIDPDSAIVFIPNDPTHPSLPPPCHLQRNLRANGDVQDHTITWHYLDSAAEGSPEAMKADAEGRGWKSVDGTFVRSLRFGDCVTLWARARFPGWVNVVEMAKVNVYWAV